MLSFHLFPGIFVLLLSFSFSLVALDMPACPVGTKKIMHEEKTATVYSCGKLVGICPESDKLEVVMEGEQCYLAEGPTFYKNQDGSQLLMRYSQALLHGEVVAANANGNLSLEENYVKGVKEGVRTLFHVNGKQKLQEHYKKGIREGIATSWYEDGKLKQKFKFKEGKRTGLYQEWFPNGKKKTEAGYTNGQWSGFYKEWYSNGNLHSEGKYKEAALEGKYILWHRNGKKMSEREYRNGRIDGKFTEWNDKGVRETESLFSQGKFIEYTYQSTQALMQQNSRKQVNRNPMLMSCATMAGMGFSPELLGHGKGCLRADFDGNGYVDDIIAVPENTKQSKVVLLKRDTILKEFVIDEPLLEIYSARSVEGQFDEPATPRDGLVAWGKGIDTHIYLFDYDKDQFVKSVHASDSY